jgi:ATP-dependent helicase/nuclease subunit A
VNEARHTPGLTDEQRRAVFTRDVSVLLSSGAGCGKTHVLTERYLAHLRDGAEVGQIVAITFTERAARQMRGRIRNTLFAHLRSAGDDDVETWTRHLRNLETAPISTIHAFCGTLLRQYAVEAGLDPGFDVLEDVLSVNISGEAIGRALQKMLTAQSEAGGDLRQLVLLFGWRAVTGVVPGLVYAHDIAAWRRWLDRPAAELALLWHDYSLAGLRPTYLAYLLAARPKIANLLPLLRRHPPLPGPLRENVVLLLEELPRLPEATDLPAAVERLNEAAKVRHLGVKAWPDPPVYEQIKKAFSDFREDLRGLKLDRFEFDPVTMIPAVEVGKRFLRVAAEAYRAYDERKRGHGVVDFQDLLVLARDLMRDQPEIRARLQERYRFLLIDELQDTDPVQMELIELLCGGALTMGKLFAVGDASQSIYRFRGADVALFQTLRLHMDHEGRQGLTLNFRSQPTILEFTNALLGDHLTPYEPLRPHHPQVNPGPCVEFLWSGCEEADSAMMARVREAGGIARRVAAMIGRERLIVDDTPSERALREVRRGDVVLLFRAMSNVHLYEAALREYGIDYYLVGGGAFFAQQEIYDLLNLLRALENPQDEVSLAGTLRSPFCCLSDETIFALRFTSTGTRRGLWQGLHDEEIRKRLPADQLERVLRARLNLDRWRTLKDQRPIARLLGEVFAGSGYDAAMQFEFLGDRKLANLWKLQELARTFDRSGLFGLAEFIERLGDLVRAQPREEQAATQPENADVVRLMTIHQAKGLEFPVVIIPDMDAAVGGTHVPVALWDDRLGCVVRPPADEEPPPFTDHAWALWKMREEVEDYRESLRTLYVACTRAKDYLILSAGLTPDLRPSSPWMQTLAGRFNLRSGECLAADVPAGETPRVRVLGSAVGIELEACPLESEAAAGTVPGRGWPEPTPAPPASTHQFDAEDGSDINDWPQE